MPNTSEPLPPAPGKQEEPDHYSLEDMMVKLKDKGHEEGELVTRADGSVAMKVRKRKRRSHQPHKEEEKRRGKMKVFRIILAGVFLLLFLLSGIALLLYYNGSGFKESIKTKTAKWTGANAEVQNLIVLPTSAKADRVLLDWPAGNYLKSSIFYGVDASLNIGSFFTGKWSGDNVVAGSGEIILKPADFTGELTYSKPEAKEGFPFQFLNFRCQKLGFKALNGAGSHWLYVDKTEANLNKTAAGSQVRLLGGVVTFTGLKPLPIKRAAFEFHDGQMKCNEGEGNLESIKLGSELNPEGYIALSGNIDLYANTTQAFSVKLNEMPLAEITANEFNRIIDGYISSSPGAFVNTLSFVPNDFSTYKVKVAFQGAKHHPIILKNFAFLETLNKEMKERNFSDYKFIKGEGVFVQGENLTRLESLNLEDNGALALRGTIELKQGVLSGEIKLGIGAVISGSNRQTPAMKKLFSEEQSGYTWCTIHLSGTQFNPADDLAQQLKTIATQLPVEELPQDALKKQIEDF